MLSDMAASHCTFRFSHTAGSTFINALYLFFYFTLNPPIIHFLLNPRIINFHLGSPIIHFHLNLPIIHFPLNRPIIHLHIYYPIIYFHLIPLLFISTFNKPYNLFVAWPTHYSFPPIIHLYFIYTFNPPVIHIHL
jgi:hypothetical protein